MNSKRSPLIRPRAILDFGEEFRSDFFISRLHSSTLYMCIFRKVEEGIQGIPHTQFPCR